MTCVPSNFGIIFGFYVYLMMGIKQLFASPEGKFKAGSIFYLQP